VFNTGLGLLVGWLDPDFQGPGSEKDTLFGND